MLKPQQQTCISNDWLKSMIPHLFLSETTDLHSVSSSWSRWRRGAPWARHRIRSWSRTSCRPLWTADPRRWTGRSHWTSLDTLLAHSGSASLPPYSPPWNSTKDITDEFENKLKELKEKAANPHIGEAENIKCLSFLHEKRLIN